MRYWLMEPAGPDEFEPTKEIDEVRWLPPDEAEQLLSYDHDRELLREVAA